MTPFWLWVSAGCAASAAFGFSAVRFAAPRRPSPRAPETELPEEYEHSQPAAAPQALVAIAAVAPERPATARPSEPIAAAPAASAAAEPGLGADPAPSAPQPHAGKLALWAHQIYAGERTMSVATDGCRVTWDRRCKHGHPSWLVHFGYLEPRPPRARSPRPGRPRG
jgi:hypothetical protein